jgi:hypothetical protein
MREVTELSEDARAVRDHFLQAWPDFERVQEMALELIRMVRNQQEVEFDAWLDRVKSCSVQSLQNFAVGLEREMDAVKAALSLSWSKRSRPPGASWDQEWANGGRGESDQVGETHDVRTSFSAVAAKDGCAGRVISSDHQK